MISTDNNGASFISLIAHHSNNNGIHRLQYYKVRKFQDFQGPSNSDSRTFKHQPSFKYFQSLEYMGGKGIQGRVGALLLKQGI